jgi:quinoprotein glucose dehydrogenase
MTPKRLSFRLLLALGAVALLLPAGLLVARPDLVAKLRTIGVQRVVVEVLNRVRRNGVVATIKGVMSDGPASAPVLTTTLGYSLYEPKEWPSLEDSASRRALPERVDVPAVDVNTLPGSIPDDRRYDTWHRSGGDASSSKYSSLNQITVQNVRRLQPAWTHALGSYLGDSTKSGATVETNPIVVGTRMYLSTIDGDVVSLDAETGKALWRLPLPAPVAKRGLVWEPNANFEQSRLFVPTGKGVVAVNAETGTVITSFGKDGVVGRGASLIAPLVLGDLLIVATLSPALEAYSLQTGQLVWTRPLLDIPDSTRTRLAGGAPWGGMSADVPRQTVFVVTGNPRPALIGVARPGKNAYSCSITAVDAKTGAVRWTFQEVEHDLWDLDLAAAPLLATITREGRRVDVVAALTKRGNTVLLDRDRGQPIFGYQRRRAPVSAIPGEQTAPYQPVFTLPEPFAKQEFTTDDITQLTPSAQRTAQRKLRGASFGFFVPPQIGGKIALYGLHGGAEWPGGAVDPTRGVIYVPSNQIPWLIRTQYADVKATAKSGADVPGDALYKGKCAQCHGQARGGSYQWEGDGDGYVPALTGITVIRRRDQLESAAYFAEQHEGSEAGAVTPEELKTLYAYFAALDKRSDAQRSFALNAFWQLVLDDRGNPASTPPWGLLTALDLNTGRKVWQVPFGEAPGLGPNGTSVRGLLNFGGVAATAGGLLFATGTTDNKLRAYDAATGAELWSYQLPAAGSTFPTIYSVNGTQYVAVVATGGSFKGFSGRSDKVMVFKLAAGRP